MNIRQLKDCGAISRPGGRKLIRNNWAGEDRSHFEVPERTQPVVTGNYLPEILWRSQLSGDRGNAGHETRFRKKTGLPHCFLPAADAQRYHALFAGHCLLTKAPAGQSAIVML